LALAAIGTFLQHPVAALKAANLALRMAKRNPGARVRHLAYFVEACYLFQRFASEPVDHVHVHFGTNPATVARLLRKLGGPHYSFTAHGPDEFDRPEALDLGGKIADALLAVAISSFGRSQMMRWSDPAHWSRISVVRCGVDASFLQDTGTALRTAVPRLCCVARLSAQKGLPLLVEAAARLRDQGLSFHLTLVGDGEMRPEIEQMIAARALADYISITGWCSGGDVRTELIGASAMILPSFAEGLPVVIMEALALQRPVIVSAIAGTPELVDRACGWIIPAGSLDDLVEAMAAALAAPVATLAKMGAAGRQRVIQQHDAEKNGARLLSLILQAHGRGA
jgi:glycosyltransferase involved in cell wall biosynthesis